MATKTTQQSAPELKVLFGGAHPKGKLSEEQRSFLQERIAQLLSPESMEKRGDILEEFLLSKKCKAIEEACIEYALSACALQLDKHITYVKNQNEIVQKNKEGRGDEEVIDKTFYLYMEFLVLTIKTWMSRYEHSPTDSETGSS